MRVSQVTTILALLGGGAHSESTTTSSTTISTTWDSIAESVTQCISSATTCRLELEKHSEIPVDRKSFSMHQVDCELLHGLWHPLYPSGESFRAAVEAEDLATHKPNEKRVYLIRHKHTTRIEKTLGIASHLKQLPVPVSDLIPCGEEHVLGHMFATSDEARAMANTGHFDFIGVLPRELKFSQPADQMFQYRNMTETTHPSHHPHQEYSHEHGLDMYIELVHGCSAHMDDTHEIASRYQRQLSDSHLGEHHLHHVEAVGQHTLVWKATRTSHHGRVTMDAVHDLLSVKPETRWIEPKIALTQLNKDSKYLVQSGLDSTNLPEVGAPFNAMDLNGRGYIVGVADSGLDTDSCFFSDPDAVLEPMLPGTRKDFLPTEHRKLAQYVAFVDGIGKDVDDHGTHVSGTVLGSSVTENTDSNGIAPEAKVAIFDIGSPGSKAVFPPPNLATGMFTPAYEVGVRVHTNSWGGQVNAYTSMTRDMDVFTAALQDFIVIVANGNLGKSDPASGMGTVAAPATSKNALSVGASQNTAASFGIIGRTCPDQAQGVDCEESVAVFSSDGPTFDGRIKPDLVAPGQYVGSAAAIQQCEVVYLQGTSMAAPVVAGAAVLAREYFERGFYPNGYEIAGNAFSPMGALLKALLVNSAATQKGNYNGQPITAWPGMEQGFGHVVLRNSLKLGDENDDPLRKVFVNGNIGNRPSLAINQEPDEYTFSIPPNPASLVKITMAFYDEPGNLGARDPKYNDIDLEVQLPDGTIVYPNGLGQADPLNTVEQVVLEPAQVAAGGDVIVRVKPAVVLSDTQDYALVVVGPFTVGTANAANLEPNVDIYSGIDLSVVAKPSKPTGTTNTMLFAIVGSALVVMGIGLYVRSQNKSAVGGSMASVGKPGTGLSPAAQGQGWSQQVDPSSGNVYFHNQATGQVQWNTPV